MVRGKNDSQSAAEMLQLMEEHKESSLEPRRGQSLYRRQSQDLNDDILKSLVTVGMDQLVAGSTTGKIALDDTITVRRKSVEYLRCCQETATFPSVLGLARCLGFTDRSLRNWRTNHADHPTGQWLQQFSDLCCDLLHQSSLKNASNGIVAIFLSKALYGLEEKNELVISAGGQDETEKPDVEELKRRYLMMNGVQDAEITEY